MIIYILLAMLSWLIIYCSYRAKFGRGRLWQISKVGILAEKILTSHFIIVIVSIENKTFHYSCMLAVHVWSHMHVTLKSQQKCINWHMKLWQEAPMYIKLCGRWYELNTSLHKQEILDPAYPWANLNVKKKQISQ